MLIILALLIPLLTTVLAASFRWRPWIGWTTAGSSAAVLGVGIALCVRTTTHAPLTALDGALRADSLSSFMVVVIGTVSLLATLFTPRTLRQEIESGVTTPRYARHYVVLMEVFITCMLVAVLDREPRSAVGVDRSDDDRHDVPGQPPPHRRGLRGFVEVRDPLLDRHRPRVPRHRAGLLRRAARRGHPPRAPRSTGRRSWPSRITWIRT